MKFSSENHSGDVNIDSGPVGFLHPFQPGIHIHIASESIFTSLRNDYSHAPESAASKIVFNYWRTGKTASAIKARVTGTLTSDILNVESVRID